MPTSSFLKDHSIDPLLIFRGHAHQCRNCVHKVVKKFDL